MTGINIRNAGSYVIGNIIYDINNSRTTGTVTIGITITTSSPQYTYGNTVHDITQASAASTSRGINNGGAVINNVVTQIDGAGTNICFSTATSNNASDDETGNITGIDSADQYVSTVLGSENLHIKDTNADIYNTGADLGTTPSGVEIDIDGQDRTGLTWDIGADEYVGAAPPATTSHTIGFSGAGMIQSTAGQIGIGSSY